MLLQYFEAGRITIQQFEWVLGEVHEGLREDPDLRAHAVKLEYSPPASETYLELVERHALCGGKPAPSVGEGSSFASSMLFGVMNKAYGKLDVDLQTYSILWAEHLRIYPSHSEILKISAEASESAAAWDALWLFVADAVERREEQLLPRSLLDWFAGANVGRPKRPAPNRALKQRPNNLGFKLRDNDIRRTVDLLEAVDLERSNGFKAVAGAFPDYIYLRRIQQICSKPYTSIADISLELRVRYRSALDPSLPPPRFLSGRSQSS